MSNRRTSRADVVVYVLVIASLCAPLTFIVLKLADSILQPSSTRHSNRKMAHPQQPLGSLNHDLLADYFAQTTINHHVVLCAFQMCPALFGQSHYQCFF